MELCRKQSAVKFAPVAIRLTTRLRKHAKLPKESAMLL